LESCSSSSPGTMNSIIFVGGTFFQAPNYKFYNFRSFSSSGTINPTIFVGGSLFFQALGLRIRQFLLDGRPFSGSGIVHPTIFVGGSLFFKLWDYKFDCFRSSVAIFFKLWDYKFDHFR